MTVAAVPGKKTVWTLDPVHSHVEFAVRHLMISTVRGRFSDVSGRVVADYNLRDPEIDVTIKVASIDTHEPDRDTHLRSADFFDAEHHPTMTFKSTRVEPQKDETLRVVGTLTIRGTSKEVALTVTPEGRGKDPWGGERAGFTATTKISRSDFGLTWNQALETGGVVVGDEIRISIDTELVKS